MMKIWVIGINPKTRKRFPISISQREFKRAWLKDFKPLLVDRTTKKTYRVSSVKSWSYTGKCELYATEVRKEK